MDPGRFIARNATLKRLIFEAWQIPWAQIAGGPAWLNSDEYDIDAKAETPANPAQLRLMLRALLTERFRLKVRSESQERRVYVLMQAKDGARLSRSSPPTEPHVWRFHGDLAAFSKVLAIQLTIPLLDDPTMPSHASGTPTPVIDKTGLEGAYDIVLNIKPDQSNDPLTIWQRALQEQAGLRLESQRAPVEMLFIEHAEKAAAAN
jgi:uncharacterized protein (TIGR03435 family)